MLESAWLFIGFLALLSTAVAVLTGDNGIAMVAGVIAFVLWGLWAFGALNIQPLDNSASPHSEPALTIAGVMMALVPGYVALTGPIELIGRVDDTRTEDI